MARKASLSHSTAGSSRDALLGKAQTLSEALPFSQEVPTSLRHLLWNGWRAGRVHWSRPWAVAVLRLWPGANGFAW